MDAVERELGRYLERMFGKQARFRYWQTGDGPMFVYTVEPYNLRYPEGQVAQGRYESVVYMPRGKGRARQWIAVPESRSYHVLRKDAKARAWKLREAHRAGKRKPWK